MTTLFGLALTLAIDAAEREHVGSDLIDALLVMKMEHVKRLHGVKPHPIDAARPVDHFVEHGR
jgi:hypothetical protein